MARLSLALLGPFQATLDREPIAGFEANKVRALLAYLAVEAYRSPRAIPRHTLAGLLWPDKPERAALANLRNALSNLRTAIGDRPAAMERESTLFLQVTRETIRFDPASDHRLDVATFQAMVEPGAVRAALTEAARAPSVLQHVQDAIALYRGDFLQGFSVRGSPEFEGWVLFERERLHALALGALDALAAYHEAHGAYQEAIAYTQRQVALEPWHEGAHRRWMRALALSGQRGMALAHYTACRQVLADELGVEPEPATTALYDQIRQGAPPRSPPFDAERRAVTVVQAVIRGATAHAGAPSGAEIVNQARRALAAEATRFGGQVYLEGVDGLAAHFGAMVAHEDDPERALLAALAMQARFDTWLAERAQGYPHGGRSPEFKLFVTIHTDQIVLPAIDKAGPECTEMREALALATRMQDVAGPYPESVQVWVSQATRRLVEPLFEWSTQRTVRVGSHGQTVRFDRMFGRKANLDKMRGVPGLSSPLIGRDRELQALQKAIDRLQQGVGGIVTLVGEAGIGKSRLVAETRQWALNKYTLHFPHPESRHLEWIEGRCLSYATHVAYQVWIDALCDLLGLERDIPPKAAADTLRGRVRALCGAQTDEVYPFLARMMSLPLDSTAAARLRGIQGEGVQVLTFRALEQLFRRAAEQAPLVVVCEDLHWADGLSVELLLSLLALADRVPILWVSVFRPETELGCWRIKEISTRRYTHRHTDLWLEPLSAAESARLVDRLLDVQDLPSALWSQILDRAEGNPFYVKELLRSLIDEGVIAYDPLGRGWQSMREAGGQALPETLRGVLMARIDRLQREPRQILQLASVLGRIFTFRLLKALYAPQPVQGTQLSSRSSGEGPAVENVLDAHLVALQRAQMIQEQSRLPEATYGFRHQLTLEAAYESLPPRKRRVLHRRAAEAVEQLFSEHVEEQLGLLAHHWERAGDVERAVSFLQRAGERAAAQFANAEAVAYLSRALELVPSGDSATRYALLLAREDVLDVQGARQAQQQDLAALEVLARDPVQRAEVAWRKARYAEMTADHRAAVSAAQEAVRLAQSAQDVQSEVEARLYWSKALTYLDRHEAARLQCERAGALAQAKGLRALEATSLHWLGRIAMFTLDAQGSKAYLAQALDILKQIGDRRGQGIVLVSLSSAYRRLADFDRCRAYGEQALGLLRETGERREEGWALLELGRASYTSQNYVAARAYWEQALPILEETRTRNGEAWTREYLGWLARDVGDVATARDYLEQALPIFGQIREHRSEGRVLVWLALHNHRLGESAAGLAYIQRALALGKRTGNLHIQATAHTFEGQIWFDLEQFAQAIAAFERALKLRHGFTTPLWAALPLTGLANVYLAQGKRAEALSYVNEVLEMPKSLSIYTGLVEPFTLYLTSYRVLHANHDPRAAEVLETAHRLLVARAARFGSEELQRAYLENVPAHREIVALWNTAFQREHAYSR